MKRNIILLGLLASMPAWAGGEKSLVPKTPSKAPDYYCTWNIQGYISSHRGGNDPECTRAQMREENIFKDRVINGKTYKAWADHYAGIQQDLLFVMDDSWDVPQTLYLRTSTGAWNGPQYPEYGLAILDQSRFPSFKGDNTARLKKLAKAIQKRGWKGLGGWVAANKTQLEPYRNQSEEEFWKARLRESQKAGVKYWKVDWGIYPGQKIANSRNGEWRRQLTTWAKEVAPDVVIEHGSFQDLANPRPEFITFSEVLRTYDVDNHVAIGQTIRRVAELLKYTREAEGLGIINCEDEPYIAAGLGCAIGVMRHELQGPMPNGKPDRTFFDETPDGRRLKQRLTETVRGVRWHRIALPFGVQNDGQQDWTNLQERWREMNGEEIRDRKSEAPARVSRGMALPQVMSDDPNRPFVLASRYPTGQTAVATTGRSLGDHFENTPVPVSIEAGAWDKEVGIFGNYDQLTIDYAEALPQNCRILAQDLATDTPHDITPEVRISGQRVVIPGTVIKHIGTEGNKDSEDLSEPGLVVVVKKK